MSIEGSLAVVGVVLLVIGVLVSARRSTSLKDDPDASDPVPPRGERLAAMLVGAGVVALVMAGVTLAAKWLRVAGLV